MKLQFEPIRLDRQEDYLRRLSQCPETASDYSVANLWAWAEEYGLCWAWTDQLVWIKQTRPREVFWAPVGPWNTLDWNVFFPDYLSGPWVFIRLPEMLLTIWKERLNARLIIEEARGHWDYLYDIHELISLTGKRFHKKKNLLNQFIRKYQYRFVPFQNDLIDSVLHMQEAWCLWRDCEAVDALAHENEAIEKVLSKWDQLKNLKGGAILIDQKIAAYTIGERLNEYTLLIHFEKGDQNYKGIYQAISQIFLESMVSDPSCQQITVVNREQDLDDEGLRSAKLSYHPIDFLKKYQVQIGK
jgi:hypothetical protein